MSTQASPGSSWAGSAQGGREGPQGSAIVTWHPVSLWQLPPHRGSLSEVLCVSPPPHPSMGTRGPLDTFTYRTPHTIHFYQVTSRHRLFSVDKSLKTGPAWPCSQPPLSPPLDGSSRTGPQPCVLTRQEELVRFSRGSPPMHFPWFPGDPASAIMTGLCLF